MKKKLNSAYKNWYIRDGTLTLAGPFRTRLDARIHRAQIPRLRGMDIVSTSSDWKDEYPGQAEEIAYREGTR